MKGQWTEYLKSIGFQDPLLQRADLALHFYSSFIGIDINLIFVSEYRDSQKGRVYESLWVFSEDYCGEANLVGEERLDLIRLTNNIAHWAVRKFEFEFGEKATEASRLTVTFQCGSSRVGGILKASGTNCLRLAEVLRKFIIRELGES